MTLDLSTPDLPTPDLPTLGLSTPDLPTSSLPAPNIPTPHLPTSSLSTLNVQTPNIPTSSLPTPNVQTPHLPSGDDRGVAGLPIRLVVAFVVGTAVLGVMLNMVSGVGALTTTELDAHPTPDVVHPGNGTIAVAAVDAAGHAVPDVTVVLSADTAGLAGGKPVVGRTNETGVATLRATPTLSATADQGTLTITVKPPSGQYADRRANADVLVVR
ncbi:DUF7382 domain-containing protein [Halarchaeum acidiphilum]|nr:carboxypeptidase regulatory-like domain-containing protein [Halarchaeum acidiphilum]